MRKVFLVALVTTCVMGIVVLMHELIYCVGVMDKIKNKQIFIPSSSKTFQMALNNSEFFNSQSKVIRKKISVIPRDIIKHLLILLISLLVLNQNLKKKAQRGISSISELIPRFGTTANFKEISFVSFTLTLLLAVVFSGGPIFFPAAKIENQLLVSIVIYSALGLIFIPFLFVFIRKLFKVYSSRLIAACYVAYYVKSISEFLTVEDVNMKSMKKLDIAQFSSTVVDYLNERHLQDRVYGEKKKSETLNAALVGWGNLERIEIYGKHKDLSDREFEAVLMHEIGHSQDYSLFKKLFVLFVAKFIEMLIVFQLYLYVSEEFSDEFLSKYGAFSVILVLYFLFMDRWIMLFHKLSSQKAENAADFIAKSHGYGDDLANVLFNISIKGETPIYSTWFYNALRSYHPTVYDRIENIKS